jgi:benzoate/toluate 1,2-dioxygenase beta subunit
MSLLAEVSAFLVQEAHLLDEGRLRDWDALFAEGGRYWVPLQPLQPDPHRHASLFYEDEVMRDVRIRRLEEAHAWSQQPPTRAARLVGNIMIVREEAGLIETRASFQLSEWRKGRTLHHLAGHYSHHLVREGGALRIQLKRVDLLNCDGIHEPFELFL